jgi:hypothetical protein
MQILFLCQPTYKRGAMVMMMMMMAMIMEEIDETYGIGGFVTLSYKKFILNSIFFFLSIL